MPFRFSGTRAVAVIAATAVAAGLASCAPGTSSEQDPGDAPLTPTVSAVPESSTTVGCDTARQDTVAPITSDDLTIGALTYPGLAHGYATHDGDLVEAGSDGIVLYKIGPQLSADAEVTVSIGTEAREYAAITVEGGEEDGYSQITYQSCPNLPADTANWWVGGFVLHGRESACVPIEVTIPGEGVERVDLAFPVGACD